MKTAAACVALTLLAACGSDGPAPATIIVVTLDTTRADRLGAYGYDGAHTPHIDALAQRGVTYDRAYAPTPITLPSHASMLTGVDPAAHGARDNGLYELDDNAEFVAEVLRDAGWATGAFVGAYVLDESFGILQGFDTWTTPSTSTLGRSSSVAERTADAVVDDAIDWLTATPRDQPAFLWVHLYDPHEPYAPPAHIAAQVDDRYDGEISFADEQLGRLLAAVEQHRPVAEHAAWTIVTADHGESLGEHGESSHGLLLYEATVRIPLIVAGPDEALEPGARSEALVSLTDVAPTVIAAAGLPAASLPASDAPSLVTSLQRPDATRRVQLETLLPYHVHRWRALRAVIEGERKTIGPGALEVFNVADDSHEQRDLAAGGVPADAPVLGEAAESLGWSTRRDVTNSERSRLQALGYLAGSTDDDDPFSLDLPDPRDRRDDIKRREVVLAKLTSGRRLLRLDPDPAGAEHIPGDTQQTRNTRGLTALAEAAATLDAMGGLAADDPWVTSHLGLVELSRGRIAEAAAAFEQHAQLAPSEAATHFNLGECYRQLGYTDWAVDEVVKTLRLEPGFALAYEWLLAWHSQKEDGDGVTYWMTRYVETFPTRDDLQQRLARLHDSGHLRSPPPPEEVPRVDALRTAAPDSWLVPERIRNS